MHLTESLHNTCPYCKQALAPKGSHSQTCPKCTRTLVPAFHPDTKELEAWIPADLGRYCVQVPAGRGGMGQVFKGQEKETGRPVAVKFPLEDAGWDPHTCRRFEREIGVLKSLTHPNLVRYLDDGVEAGKRYYVMEWVEGEDFAKVLTTCREQGRYLPFELVHPSFQQLCLALQTLHDRGIVHRDLKPSNVIMMPDKSIKLIDLGIAKVLDQQSMETPTTGAIGTDQYFAPEQLVDPRSIDQRVDVYALGVVIYELLTGRVPRGSVQMPSSVNSTVPCWFDDLLLMMMEHNPDQRPSAIGPLAVYRPASGLRAIPHRVFTAIKRLFPPVKPTARFVGYGFPVGVLAPGLVDRFLIDLGYPVFVAFPIVAVTVGGLIDWAKAMAKGKGQTWEAQESGTKRKFVLAWTRLVGAWLLSCALAVSCFTLFTAPKYQVLNEVERMKQARELVSDGKDDEAIALYSKVIEEIERLNSGKPHPLRSTLYCERGFLHKKKGELDRAIEDLDRSLGADPSNRLAYYNRGIIFSLKEKHDEAIADLAEAIRLDPSNSDAFLWRAGNYLRKKELDHAIADLDKCLGLDPENAVAYQKRGDIFSEKKNRERAIADFTELIKLGPRNSHAYLLRGAEYISIEDPDRAIRDLNEAIRLSPKMGRAYLSRSLAYWLKGDKEKSATDYAEAIRLDPKLANIDK